MKAYQASTTINASPEKIWSIITDTSSYPEWDPYCIRIEGEAAPGETLKAYTKLSPDRAFPAKVTTFDPHKKMVWTGGMPLGLFKGERSFVLSAKDDRQTEFTVSEVFTGPLLVLMSSTIPDMTEPFEKFVEGLKARAERKI